MLAAPVVLPFIHVTSCARWLVAMLYPASDSAEFAPLPGSGITRDRPEWRCCFRRLGTVETGTFRLPAVGRTRVTLAGPPT